MRRQLSSALAIVMLFTAGDLFSQAESLPGGGPWTSPSTWKDGVVPNPGDRVIIKGPVTVEVYTQAAELKIDPGGSLMPEVINTNTIYQFHVTTGVTNLGTIKGRNLQLYVGGNVYNTGAWSTGTIFMQDTTTHYLTAPVGSPISAVAIRADSATLRTDGNVELDSVQVWVKRFLLGNNSPVFPHDTLFATHHSELHIGEFIGNGNPIYLRDDSFIGQGPGSATVPTYADVHLGGDVALGVAMNFTGDIVLDGKMFPRFNSFSPTLTINGNFTNNGEIAPSVNGFGIFFHLSGNLTNNGKWVSNLVEFVGAGPHVLSTDPNQPFSPSNLKADGSVISGSDVRLDGVTARIKHFELRPGDNLYLNQGSSFWGDEFVGNGGTIQMLDDSYLAYSFSSGGVVPTYRDVNLRGQARIGAGSIQFFGATALEGSLAPRFSSASPTMIFHGAFVNNGDILAGPNGYLLFFQCYGDVVNHGNWVSNLVELAGGGVQTLVTDSTGSFSPLRVYSDSATVRSGSDLRFVGAAVKLKRLELQPGHDVYLEQGSSLGCEELFGNGNTLHLAGDSYLTHGRTNATPVLDHVNLEGEVKIASNLIFTGPVELLGLMAPRFSSSSPMLTFRNDFTNKGEITSGPNGYWLSFEIGGDLANFGRWRSNIVKIPGAAQHTLVTDTSRIFSPSKLYADSATIVSGSPLRFDNVQFRVNKLLLQSRHDVFLRDGSNLWAREVAVNGNRLHLSGGSYLARSPISGTTAVYRDAVLDGDVGVSGNLFFAGNTYLLGTMHPRFNSQSPGLTFLNFFQNQGQIQPGPNGYRFQIAMFGDFENLGVCDVDRLEFDGDSDQHIGIEDSAATLTNVYFKSEVTGNSYQWLRDGAPLSNGGNVSGATQSELRLAQLGLTDAGAYQCRIDSAGTVRMSRKIIVNNQITAVKPPYVEGRRPRDPGKDGATQGLPREYTLWQNTPNPFNPTTTIRFDLPVQAEVTLFVFDAAGRLVARALEAEMSPGRHAISFDGSRLASGIYFYRLQAVPVDGGGRGFVETRKMILLK